MRRLTRRAALNAPLIIAICIALYAGAIVVIAASAPRTSANPFGESTEERLAHLEDSATESKGRLDSLEKADLKTKLAVLEDRQDTILRLSYGIIVAVAAELILHGLRLRQISQDRRPKSKDDGC